MVLRVCNLGYVQAIKACVSLNLQAQSCVEELQLDAGWPNRRDESEHRLSTKIKYIDQRPHAMRTTACAGQDIFLFNPEHLKFYMFASF